MSRKEVIRRESAGETWLCECDFRYGKSATSYSRGAGSGSTILPSTL